MTKKQKSEEKSVHFGENKEIEAEKHEEEESDDEFGPVAAKRQRTRKPLEFENLYLSMLPNSEMYEKSYMHVQAITHVECTKTDFFITASKDGQIKFWKKKPQDVEFVKRFYAHRGRVCGLSVTTDGLWLATTSSFDKTIKVFDIINFDMINMIQVEFAPSACEWIHHAGAARLLIACGDTETGSIRVFDGRGSATPLHTISIHAAPITVIKFNPHFGVIVSSDTKGMIEYWDATTHSHPTQVSFTYKTETDLFDLCKGKTYALSLSISPNGKRFSIIGKDRQIRVFNFKSAKLFRKYDESLAVARELQASNNPVFKLDEIDFGRRLAVENNIDQDTTAAAPSAVFDESSNFLFYPTLIGIKLVNLHSNRVVKILGKFENTERFLNFSLYQARPRTAGQIGENEPDPTLIATAFDKQRFYLFTRREPRDENADSRDVFNEKPPKEMLQAAASTAKSNKLGHGAVLHTSMGDIVIKLFPDECPKTVENFCTHARNGYFANVIFHRVIKNFMIQTGDPMGDGTGGTSIWGKEFEDEFHRNLRHDRPFTVSMANAGPNTNGSQFFITTVPCPWLDNKHTVFGRVHKGTEVVQKIEGVNTDEDDMPTSEVKVINITVYDELPE